VKQLDFTIVTPSFKQLDYLGCCIASVADQIGVTVEHIVQDAGSLGIEEFEIGVWRLLSATGELRHFYKNGVGEATTFPSEMGESVLGIEIADGLRERAVDKIPTMGVGKSIEGQEWISPEVEKTEG